MSKKGKVLLIISVSLTIIVLFIHLVLTGIADFMCANTKIKALESPNGEFIAYAYLRDCGATTSYGTHVSLFKGDRVLKNSESGNVYRGYKSDYINIKWQDNQTLIIYHNSSEENIFKDLKSKYGVKILYVKKP